MFLDYIQSEESRNQIRRGGSMLIRMPQIIVLVGDFTPAETEVLENQLQTHFPSGDAISWISLGENRLSAWTASALDIPSGADGYLKKREDLASKCVCADAKRFVEETVAGIFNATAGLACQEAGGVQVALLVKADQPQAGMLVPFLKLLKDELREQFIRVNMEAYLFVDQSAYREARKEREASVYLTLRECNQLMKDQSLRLVYVLSNVTNRGYLLEQEKASREQMASAALMIALKDLIADNGSYCYSDRDFGKGVANVGQASGLEPGLFSSIGHMSLQTDEKFNTLVAYRTVWESLGTSDPELDIESLQQELGLDQNGIKQFFGTVGRSRELSEQDFEAIVRDRNRQEQSVYTMACGTAISQFFGNNLALYQELNMPPVNPTQKLNDWQDGMKKKLQALSDQVSFFDIALILEKAEQDAQELIAQSDELVADRKNKLSQWEGITFAQQGVKMSKGMSPLYVLAQNYLKRKNALYAAQQQKRMIGGFLEKLHALGTCYRNYKKLVLDTIDSIDKEMEEKLSSLNKPGNGLGKLQITNAETYYAEVTRRRIAEDSGRAYRHMGEQLRAILNTGSLQETAIFESVYEFCKKHIFTDPTFRIGFLEELQHRLMGYQAGEWDIQNGTDVSNFLLTSIVDTKHYLFYDRINQGFQAYEEMVLFLQSDSIFNQEKDRSALVANMIREQQMKLFADRNSDSLDVLFLAGNLRMESLHKWDLYEEAWKQLTGGEENDD